MSEEEIKGPPSPESKLTWGRVVAGLCALATIVGGVAAGLQIYREAENSPPKKEAAKKEEPEKEVLEAGWRRESLEGGMTVALPPSWKPVDRDGLISLMRSMDGPNARIPFEELDSSDLISFVVEHSENPDAPTVFVAFGAMDAKSTATLDEQLDDMRRDPRCQAASKITMPQGDALHAIMIQWMARPDGSEFPMVVDTYMIQKYDRLWTGILYIREADHLPYSGTFRKVMETFRAPIPEPPPPGTGSTL